MQARQMNLVFLFFVIVKCSLSCGWFKWCSQLEVPLSSVSTCLSLQPSFFSHVICLAMQESFSRLSLHSE